MKLSQFKYHLPQEQIALFPTEERDEARMMVLHRKTQTIEHKIFKDIVDYFVYLKDDEHINEFPEQTMNILYDAIKNIKKLLTEKEYGKREKYILELTIEEGERVIKTSTIFAPSYL